MIAGGLALGGLALTACSWSWIWGEKTVDPISSGNDTKPTARTWTRAELDYLVAKYDVNGDGRINVTDPYPEAEALIFGEFDTGEDSVIELTEVEVEGEIPFTNSLESRHAVNVLIESVRSGELTIRKTSDETQQATIEAGIAKTEVLVLNSRGQLVDSEYDKVGELIAAFRNSDHPQRGYIAMALGAARDNIMLRGGTFDLRLMVTDADVRERLSEAVDAAPTEQVVPAEPN